MIEGIIFDFDGTLVDYHKVDKKALFGVVSRMNKNVDGEEFYEQSGEILANLYELGIKFESEIHRERLLQTCKYFGMEYKEQYLKEYFSIYLNENKPYEGAAEILEYLKGKVRLGLLTNAMDIKEQRERIRNSGLEKYFDVICLAEEIDAYKPDKKAFEIMADKLGSKPHKIIFIGDSEKNDIKGAKNARMITIKKNNKIKKQTAADYQFTEYLELQRILEEIGIKKGGYLPPPYSG